MSPAVSPPFLDTSYVVRYFTNDPPDMADHAAHVIDSEEMLVLSELALVESAYVLESVYKVQRSRLVDALIDLVQRQNLVLAQLPKFLALEALRVCRDSRRNSFTDAFLWAQARAHGAERIYSFDSRFLSEGLTIIGMEESK